MDLSFLTHPSVLIFLLSAIAGLIWRISRLQVKVDRLEEENKQQNTSLAETRAGFQAHKDNSDIHFNLRISQEVDRRNEQRFVMIEKQLGEINGKLDRLAEKE